MHIFALSDFWQGFLLLLIWIPLIFLWAAALVDIIRRNDLSGWGIFGWLLLIFILQSHIQPMSEIPWASERCLICWDQSVILQV